MKVFKIQDRTTCKFSSGGTSPNWTLKGKVWVSMAALKNHLRQFCEDIKRTSEGWKDGWWNDIPETWDVIELSSETGLSAYSAKNLYPETSGVKSKLNRGGIEIFLLIFALWKDYY